MALIREWEIHKEIARKEKRDRICDRVRESHV